MGHKAVIAFEMGENRTGFGPSKNDRELRRAPDPLNAGDELKLLLQHLLVEEKQGAKGLILGRGGYLSINGKVAEILGNFFFAHFGRVAFFVEENETANPIEVSLLSSN